MADNIPVMTPDASCEIVERSHGIDIGMACKKLAIAVGAAIALHTSPALAQTNPASSSTSATLQPTKGLGYGQYASNGESFAQFLQTHGDASLDEAELMVDAGKWTEKDYDTFVKYQDSHNVAQLISRTAEKGQIDKAVESLDHSNEGKKQAAIEKVTIWWSNMQPKLSLLGDTKAVELLKQDLQGTKALLQFIVANNIPPPGEAKKYLKLL